MPTTDNIHRYLDEAFADVPHTPETADLKEEIRGNLQARVAELETGDHVVRFCDLDIGLIDRRGLFTRFAARREGSAPRVNNPLKPKLSGIMPVQNVDNHSG